MDFLFSLRDWSRSKNRLSLKLQCESIKKKCGAILFFFSCPICLSFKYTCIFYLLIWCARHLPRWSVRVILSEWVNIWLVWLAVGALFISSGHLNRKTYTLLPTFHTSTLSKIMQWAPKHTLTNSHTTRTHHNVRFACGTTHHKSIWIYYFSSLSTFLYVLVKLNKFWCFSNLHIKCLFIHL